MNLDDIIFIDNLPTLDLHGQTSDLAGVMVNDFIRDNLKCKNEFVVIIHGFGAYILKNKTHEILSKNKYVLGYKLFIYNAGCTIVKLDLKKF